MVFVCWPPKIVRLVTSPEPHILHWKYIVLLKQKASLRSFEAFFWQRRTFVQTMPFFLRNILIDIKSSSHFIKIGTYILVKNRTQQYFKSWNILLLLFQFRVYDPRVVLHSTCHFYMVATSHGSLFLSGDQVPTYYTFYWSSVCSSNCFSCIGKVISYHAAMCMSIFCHWTRFLPGIGLKWESCTYYQVLDTTYMEPCKKF